MKENNLVLVIVLGFSLKYSVTSAETDLSALLKRLYVLEMKINVIDRLELKVERRDEENKRLKDENTDIQKQLCKMAESLKQRTVHHRTTTKTKNAKSNSPVDVFTTSNKPKGQGPQRQRNGDGIERRLLLGITRPTSLTPIVAFRTLLSKTLTHTGIHQTIEYDAVSLNIGHAYDARHGHRTAPVKGIYLVSVTAVAVPGKRLVLDVVLNSNVVVIMETGQHSSYSANTKTFPHTSRKGRYGLGA